MKRLFALLLLLVPILLYSANVTVKNDVTSDVTWTSDNVYFLDGLIFVDSLATLTIQAGTVVKGLQQQNITTGDGASALVVRRGGKLMADGRQAQPIIFTSELDDIADPGDLFATDRGKWGGVILLGRARTNQPTTNNQIEGIPSEINALYGGVDDNDNSGVLRYISIRHGGFSISGTPGDEINGLTMGAVGRGTAIDHIEVFANFDDAYEWFGGTVETKYLVAAFCGDDGFDYDQGFRGKGQFWFSIQATDQSGRAGEHDGGDDDETGTPYAIPVISNATYIGAVAAGADTTGMGGDRNDKAIYFRDNAGGKYYNSIITEFGAQGIKIEDLAEGEDSRSRLENGDLVLKNNIWWQFGDGNTIPEFAHQDFVQAYLSSAATMNQAVDPLLRNIPASRQNALNEIDPRPKNNSPAVGTAMTVDDSFFDKVSYLGAFNPAAPLWTDGWTALSQDRYTTDLNDHQKLTTVATDLELLQNYPNPFNPETTIEFALPKSGPVSLFVYNSLGQVVTKLVDGNYASGIYRVSWNAENLTSGIYFYRLEANGVEKIRKMLFTK